MEKNIMIAEFMGYKKRVYFPTISYLIPNIHEIKNSVVWVEDINLKFHSSWDWLIPVVKKCLCTGDNTERWDDIINEMSTVDIDKLYSEVVCFIDWFNREKEK